ncbi:pyrimidine reductase family protein [Corynebacterium sp. H127]|uniref:pyrimidine reductase family protein n=1 Tax=Corynebacterium sp. H127 TaxID=3133418 RepID=UPI0030A0E6DB
MITSLIGPTLPVGEPEVRAIAVITADGQASMSGTSQSMGSPLDAQLLQELRQWADVVLVGAQTARAENYGGVVSTPEQRTRRQQRGQKPVPPIAVITRSLDVPPQLLAGSGTPPLLLSPHAATHPTATVVQVPEEDYIQALHRLGFARIVVEGGPSIYAAALAGREVDLLHLSIDPTLALTTHTPLLTVDGDTHPQRLQLESCMSDPDGCVFLRYRCR